MSVMKKSAPKVDCERDFRLIEFWVCTELKLELEEYLTNAQVFESLLE